MPYIRVINKSDVVKCSGFEQVYFRYQICALTACELPCLYMDWGLLKHDLKVCGMDYYAIRTFQERLNTQMFFNPVQTLVKLCVNPE